MQQQEEKNDREETTPIKCTKHSRKCSIIIGGSCAVLLILIATIITLYMFHNQEYQNGDISVDGIKCASNKSVSKAPHPESCEYYFQCYNGVITKKSEHHMCFSKTKYDEKRGDCVPKDEWKKEDNLICHTGCNMETGVYTSGTFLEKDLETSDKDECSSLCASTAGCVAWNFRKKDNYCWLLADDSGRSDEYDPSDGWVTGTNKCGVKKDQTALGSSVKDNNILKYGAGNAIDGKDGGKYFESVSQIMPYLEITHPVAKISDVKIVNKQQRESKLTEVRVGNESLPEDFKMGQQIGINILCGRFSGHVNENGEITIKCDKVIEGNVTTIQIIENTAQTLIINEITVHYKNPSTLKECILAAVISISITALIGCSIYIYCRRIKKQRSRKQQVQDALKGDESAIDPNQSINNQIENLSYDRKYELNENQFTIGHKIGDGQFGVVSVGTARNVFGPGDIQVAIKQVKNELDTDQLSTIIGELKIMSNLGSHLNLVNLVGACTSESTNKICVLLEFCKMGDLKKVLMDNKNNFLGSINKFSGYSDTQFNPTLLLNWSYQIAKGMEYLENKMVMHGDLAARNILVSHDLIAKISDFGLSKHMHYEEVYKKKNRRMIPWAWMGLEYLQTGNFQLKSDVWSFGILLWEIYSLGNKPYDYEPYEKVKNRLGNGERLPIPEDMNELDRGKNIYYSIMKPCWEAQLSKRPNFKALVIKLEKLMQQGELEKYKDKFKKFQEAQKKSQVSPEKQDDMMENNGDYLLANHSKSMMNQGPEKGSESVFSDKCETIETMGGFPTGRQVIRDGGFPSGRQISRDKGFPTTGQVSRDDGHLTEKQVSSDKGYLAARQVSRDEGYPMDRQVSRDRSFPTGRQVSRDEGYHTEKQVSGNKGYLAARKVSRDKGYPMEKQESRNRGFPTGTQVTRYDGYNTEKQVSGDKGYLAGRQVSRDRGFPTVKQVSRDAVIESKGGYLLIGQTNQDYINPKVEQSDEPDDIQPRGGKGGYVVVKKNKNENNMAASLVWNGENY